jgi:lysophospholipase L1-like esterase
MRGRIENGAWVRGMLVSIVLVVAYQASAAQGSPQGEHWVSSWATAQQLTPITNPPWAKPPPKVQPEHSPILPVPERLKDQTVRMLIRTTIGGKQLRVQLSNAQGYEPVAIGSVHVALHGQGSGIVAGSDRTATFGGQARVKLPPGAVIVSDPIDLSVAPLSTVAISLYVPGKVGQLTVHPLGLHTTYLATGDLTAAGGLPGATECNSYFWLTGLDVLAPAGTHAIVAFGDSITDGYATTPNADHAWPSLLFERSMAGRLGTRRSVVNLGISGNRVLHDGSGTSALARFDRDVLSRPGVRWIIFLEGINDISFPAIPGAPAEDHISAEDLIAGYRKFIDKAHLHGLKIVGGTILPWEGVWTYTPEADAIRQRVNQWIRSSRAFDQAVDFDAITRDPTHPTRLDPKYDSGDHVHPNDAGNRAMAEAIGLSFFGD